MDSELVFAHEVAIDWPDTTYNYSRYIQLVDRLDEMRDWIRSYNAAYYILQREQFMVFRFNNKEVASMFKLTFG